MKNKHIFFYIGGSILYICLIQLAHAILYTQVLKGQSTRDALFFVNTLCYILLWIPIIAFGFVLLKNNSIKTIPSLFSVMLKENGIIIILYVLLLYVICKNCFSGYWVVDLFGKQIMFSEKQSYLLAFCSYLFDGVATFCVMGITPFIGYVALKSKYR